MFVQTALAAALVRADPRVAGLNFVGPEDYRVARRDYRKHMADDRLPRRQSERKRVPVALHAGELWVGLVPPDDLDVPHPRRGRGRGRAAHRPRRRARVRGHARSCSARCARRKVAVEINLTSNDVILGVRGKDHPLTAYRAARRAGGALDRRRRRLAHRPHERVFPRRARLSARLSRPEGDRAQLDRAFVPRRGREDATRSRDAGQGLRGVRSIRRQGRRHLAQHGHGHRPCCFASLCDLAANSRAARSRSRSAPACRRRRNAGARA